MNYQPLSILVAYSLDLILGDPQLSWHPVRLIGSFIERLEKTLNIESMHRKLAGLILVILVVGITVICVGSILKLAKLIHPIFYYLVSVLLIYFALSIKSLGKEAGKVYAALMEGNVTRARMSLSMIVARDTDKLNETEIIRATVETVAESIMDGIIAPLFYVFLGGPILAWTYKAINTLDSMVGYRSERFIDFGKASAKIDGIANFIPAKLTCLAIFLSSLCYKKYWKSCAKWALKYSFKGPQYNSEATEATMAGALGTQLGGLNFYNSVPLENALIGYNRHTLERKHIKESIKIAYISSLLFICIGIFLILLIEGG